MKVTIYLSNETYNAVKDLAEQRTKDDPRNPATVSGVINEILRMNFGLRRVVTKQ